MIEKKRVLFLTPGFPGNDEETDCIPALQLFLHALDQTGLFEISVIAFHYPYREDRYNWKGIQVFALGGNNRKGLKRAATLQEGMESDEIASKRKVK